MASTTTIGLLIPISASAAIPVLARANRRRRITPQAGHALEKLGHAIEYLADEFVHTDGSFCVHNAHVEAVRMLMALNRQVYFECPEIPSIKERFLSMLRLVWDRSDLAEARHSPGIHLIHLDEKDRPFLVL
jgi:hypothetical protein